MDFFEMEFLEVFRSSSTTFCLDFFLSSDFAVLVELVDEDLTAFVLLLFLVILVDFLEDLVVEGADDELLEEEGVGLQLWADVELCPVSIDGSSPLVLLSVLSFLGITFLVFMLVFFFLGILLESVGCWAEVLVLVLD